MSNIIKLSDVYSIIPDRATTSSKHDYGRLLAVCGSSYYRGAAYLSCAAALYCGVGIVTLASTEKVIASVANNLHECTYLPLIESKNGTVAAENADVILESSKKHTAILIGCGLALDSDTKQLVKRIVAEAQCQLIIDADGLNVLSECPDIIKQAKLRPVITPHFNEMSRLSGKNREEIAESPEKTALDFAAEYNCTVVLKSHITYIAAPGGKMAVNSKTGNPGLAKGGSGDVLAGMISSFCAQNIRAFDAAKCGVYLHGLSADRCADRLSQQAMRPSDILTDLCEIFLEK